MTDPNDLRNDLGSDPSSEQRELAAAERLTSAPATDTNDSGSGGEGDDVVGIGVVGWLRWGWRQLTSMRTALILLFLLSLAAVPGSLVPQTSASEINVQNFHANHKLLAPLFDKLDMFDVYGSFWFSAIYILLFISLLGCIIPRTYQFVGVLRAKPPNLGVWSPIGGKLEMTLGESPFECAVRETEEEVGVKLQASDLHLFASIAEKAYEGQTHWLLFLFQCKKTLAALPPDIIEGKFGFFSAEAMKTLPLPETDRTALWPIYHQYRDRFVMLKADCQPGRPVKVDIEEITPTLV